jgi:hypothetical protein
MNRFLTLAAVVLVLAACRQGNSSSFSPKLPAYGNSPQKLVSLKKPLREISGIFYVSDSTLCAVNDEEGALFSIHPSTGEFSKTVFGSAADYEDIVATNDAFYVLESSGIIHQLDKSGKQMAVYDGRFPPSAEFESMWYDASKQELLLLCKSCKGCHQQIPAYRFNLADHRFSTAPVFTIAIAELRKIAQDNSLIFKPSAAAIHPVTGELFVLASVGKLLLICSSNGTIKQVYKLNPLQFTQPEGLCFTPAGDLYISNEGGDRKASLLYFAYTQPVLQ